MLHNLLLTAVLLLGQSPFPTPSASNDHGLGLAVRPADEQYTYSLGDTARFEVSIQGDGKLQLSYNFSHGKARVYVSNELSVTQGTTQLAYAMSEPGFLRLDITLRSAAGDSVRAAQAVGFDPHLIRPTGSLPDDFERFWGQGLAELLRVDPDPEVIPVEKHDYHIKQKFFVSLGNIEGSRIFGWLSVPHGKGPFPAVVHIPGAPGGVNEFHTSSRQDYAEHGIMVLSLNIHGVPIDLPEETYLYYYNRRQLGYAPLSGVDDKYRYYYRRVVLGGIRALDYLHSRTDVDTCRIAVAGGSQGGGLSLLVTSIDRRVDALVLHVPAMCDYFGIDHGRPTGWPHLLRRADSPQTRHTASYFDGALAASKITCPVVVGVSLLDEACPPTTVYSMFNSLAGPKEIIVHPGVHHPGSFTVMRNLELISKLRNIFFTID